MWVSEPGNPPTPHPTVQAGHQNPVAVDSPISRQGVGQDAPGGARIKGSINKPNALRRCDPPRAPERPAPFNTFYTPPQRARGWWGGSDDFTKTSNKLSKLGQTPLP
ncbi:hypothetical protein AAFF_G00258150 [Aldrovandia affinis]|uniref:Uncharacterized protein n=1 Tax=Aldrovandia affinis TaxID=143900 RepID=A0AAD7WT24_9TELE|nr:hypothetical protein AAFF_G00258150 [Aldrovandia affinis]